jgi:hypothetical protein
MNLKETGAKTLKYILMTMIVPLITVGGVGYVASLVIKDTEEYKRIDTVVKWYEAKSKSFAVGLRINKFIDERTGNLKYKVVYKCVDGELRDAFYSSDHKYWYYIADTGQRMECH